VTLSRGARRLAEEAGIDEITVTLTHQVDLVVAVAAADPGRRLAAEILERLARLEMAGE
jgi:hypothetical protein